MVLTSRNMRMRKSFENKMLILFIRLNVKEKKEKKNKIHRIFIRRRREEKRGESMGGRGGNIWCKVETCNRRGRSGGRWWLKRIEENWNWLEMKTKDKNEWTPKKKKGKRKKWRKKLSEDSREEKTVLDSRALISIMARSLICMLPNVVFYRFHDLAATGFPCGVFFWCTKIQDRPYLMVHGSRAYTVVYSTYNMNRDANIRFATSLSRTSHYVRHFHGVGVGVGVAVEVEVRVGVWARIALSDDSFDICL